MNESINKDYLKFVFYRTSSDLAKYSISLSDYRFINRLLDRIISSANLSKDLYILSNVQELKNIGKYIIFIIKKLQDNVITFDNLTQNLKADVTFIEKEILNYLSNPQLKKSVNGNKEVFQNSQEDSEDESISVYSETNQEIYSDFDSDDNAETLPDDPEITDDSEISNFKKNYLELIQSEEENNENVFELPAEGDGEAIGEIDPFSLPDSQDINQDEKTLEVKQDFEEALEKDEEEIQIAEKEESVESVAGNTEETPPDESLRSDNFFSGNKIQLSEEIQEELENYEEEKDSVQENLFEEQEPEVAEETATNEMFLQFEREVINGNSRLDGLFDRMIYLVNEKTSVEEERGEIIGSILELSRELEGKSRDKFLEVISNIYQTITFSFEKISDGKYDISQSTLNLFKKSLTLVISLIKGEDYFGYKDVLKSVENIRNILIEERHKKEQYRKQKEEKTELEKKFIEKYPEHSQRLKVSALKKLIKDTENNFNDLEKISGEYQIYEALRSLSGNLNNFKEIVKIAKELRLNKLVQLSESGYIFIKFLQNYRINPVTIEIKEIFGYIIYNLKSLVLGKDVSELDLFISYLNDPVKIFSKKEKKKN